MRVLVGYVTKTGTTAEIAERIGNILKAQGAEVDIAPISALPGEGKDLGHFDRLVLGSPVNGMKVLPEFNAFVDSRAAGSGKPADIFIVSYLAGQGYGFWKKAVEKERDRLAQRCGGRGVIFGGRLTSKLPGFARLMFGTPKDLPLDVRDWKAIEDWAQSLLR